MNMDTIYTTHSPIREDWAAPGARETTPKGERRSLPPFGRVLREHGAVN